MRINRTLEDQVKLYLEKYPIIAITGPRQSGKTTFLKSTFSEYQYITLENPDVRSFALEDPNGFLGQFKNKVIFDEIQRVPQLFSYLQSTVDESGIMGQFILSGSQNFQLMEEITQSLAGRVGIFKLFPFDIQEIKSAQWLKADLAEQLFFGFYPAIYDRDINPSQYLTDYLETYVYRDIRNLQNIQNMDSFHRLIRICASNAGQLVNYSHFSKLLGVSHSTIRQWISLLKTSYIIFELTPYFNDYKKRIVKRPKLYFYDTGLLSRLLELQMGQLTPLHPNWGAIFENFVVAEFVKQNAHHNLHREFYFWRDSNGHEADIVFRDGQSVYLIEIKAGKTVKTDMFKQLDFISGLITDLPVQKMLVYGGETNQKRTNYQILSWKNIELQ